MRGCFFATAEAIQHPEFKLNTNLSIAVQLHCVHPHEARQLTVAAETGSRIYKEQHPDCLDETLLFSFLHLRSYIEPGLDETSSEIL